MESQHISLKVLRVLAVVLKLHIDESTSLNQA